MIARDRFYSFCSVPTEKDILTTCRVLKTCCEASPLDVLFKIPLVSTHCVRGTCLSVFKLLYFRRLLELLNFYSFSPSMT